MLQTNKFWTVTLSSLVAAIILILAFASYRDYRNQQKIRQLQDEIAKRDVTVKVQEGVFARLTRQIEDVQGAIDRSTEDGQKLSEEVKKSKAELVAVNTSLIKLREQVARGKGSQTDVPPKEPGGVTRKKVEFDQDFGFVRVRGFTLTDPGEYQLELRQGDRPLRLSLALTQQKDRSWRTIVTSSDKNVDVDIQVSAVNPLALSEKWYEKIQLKLDFGVGNGLLIGAGAGYQFGNLQLGPSIWGVASDHGGVFYGASLGWSPFKRK